MYVYIYIYIYIYMYGEEGVLVWRAGRVPGHFSATRFPTAPPQETIT